MTRAQGAHIVYTMGVDPAASVSETSDDGVVSVLAHFPRRPDVPGDWFSAMPSDWYSAAIYSHRVRNASGRQWSGHIHHTARRFNTGRRLMGIMMDPNGGGYQIGNELDKPKQLILDVETDVTPIVQVDVALPDAWNFLHYFKRGDPAIELLWPNLADDAWPYDNAHVQLQDAVEGGRILFPKPTGDLPGADETFGAIKRSKDELKVVEAKSKEWQWALKLLTGSGDFDGCIQQLANVAVPVDETGAFIQTRSGARGFKAGKRKGRKDDIAYSILFAYVEFLSWLKKGAESGLTEEELGLCSVL